MGGFANQLKLGRRLEAAIVAVRDHAFVGRRRIWITAAIVALLAWPLGIALPTTSLDSSWMSGLYMGLQHDKDFGTEVVFTYGPLGFLDWPALWASWLAVLAYAFSAVVYYAFVVTFVGLLQRTVGLLGAAVIAFLYLATIPDMEQLPLILAVAWSLTALREDRPGFAVDLLAVGGGSLAALECLIKLSAGPTITIVCLLAMIGARATRRQWALFVGFFVGGVLVLWLVTGQPLGSLWDYGVNGAQVVSGYNEAMEISGAPTWAKGFLLFCALGLVMTAYLARTRDRRARWAAVLLTAVASFSSYKYGIVRFEPVHLSLGLSAMLGIWLIMPWRRSLSPAFLTASILLGLVLLHIYPTPARLDPIKNVITFGEEAELAARPGLRQEYIDFARSTLQSTYAVDPETLALLKGKRVEVDPWEIAVAWAYELDWSPFPVIQNYTAYTQKLDRLNSESVEDAEHGPQVILRQNPGGTLPLGGARSFQGRQPAWDPPEQNFKILCYFASVNTSLSWQVLERVPNRCGPDRLIGEAEANTGEPVQVPQAHHGEVVLMKIEGAKVEGFEKLRSMLWRPRIRTAVLNDGLVSYQLVPDTTEDGMVVSRDPRLDGTGGFEQFPQVQNLKIEGISRHLHFKFYGVKVKVEQQER
ncbi:MAG: hypothetical protein JWO14_3864 [Solirubrobacterales bacterium]|nr:hypothetical protein [Solirubrobacterales bacterium]